MHSDVRYGWRRIGKLRQVRRTTDLCEPFAVTQPRRDGYDIRRRPRRRELANGLENAPVGVTIEVLDTQDSGDGW
jgi:CHASE1-domain containing sensor protein